MGNFRGEDFFLISSPFFSIFSLAAILVGSRDHRTQFWKGAIQGSFHKSLVAIGPVVSEEKMILGWSPFKNVSVSAVLYPRGPPILKIEISSNGQICSNLSQKVPKFELYKHNDSFLTYITGFFMNFELLPILTDYEIKKRGE
jgi:hypothetical protein